MAFSQRRSVHGHATESRSFAGAKLVSVMDLLEALREQVRLYLRRRQPLLCLREWLERHDDEVAASSDEALREFDAAVWALLSEGDLGTLTEDEIRSALRRELGFNAPRQHALEVS
jgi:hypothetical protein